MVNEWRQVICHDRGVVYRTVGTVHAEENIQFFQIVQHTGDGDEFLQVLQ